MSSGEHKIDREAPTPRLTGTWTIHEEHAHLVSEQLRAHSKVAAAADMLRSKRLRDLSDVAEAYARAFRRWSLEDIPAVQKMRERSAFSLLVQCIDEELKTP